MIFTTTIVPKATRQLIFATKKHTRQPGKAYAATCICYGKVVFATKKHTRQLVFATKKHTCSICMP